MARTPKRPRISASIRTSRRLSDRLLGIVRELSYVSTLEQVTAIVRTAVRDLTGADGATFVLREGDLVHYVDEDAIGPLWKGKRFDLHACISGWVILNRKGASIEDIRTDPRIPIEAYRTTFVRSLAMAPIRSEDPLGAIGAYWGKRHKPSPRELGVLQSLADAAALAFAKVVPEEKPEGERAQSLRRLRPGKVAPTIAIPGRLPRVIAIGASAGGTSALRRLLSELPNDLNAAIFIVLHTPANGGSRLVSVLSRTSSLPVCWAVDGEPIRPARVYVAPPDRHLLVDRGVVRVVDGVAENFVRPAIDPLLRTASVSYRNRVTGILLSGNFYDGTAGLLAVKMHGGVTIVQDPGEATFPRLCLNAIRYVEVDHVLTLADIAELLSRRSPRPTSLSKWRRGKGERSPAATDTPNPHLPDGPGESGPAPVNRHQRSAAEDELSDRSPRLEIAVGVGHVRDRAGRDR